MLEPISISILRLLLFYLTSVVILLHDNANDSSLATSDSKSEELSLISNSFTCCPMFLLLQY